VPCTATSRRARVQRLVVNAEDVAFNDPPAGAAEQMILNRHLQRLLRHARLSAFQRFIQQARAPPASPPRPAAPRGRARAAGRAAWPGDDGAVRI